MDAEKENSRQIRNLLERCRHAKEEMQALQKQLLHAQPANAQAYRDALQMHHQEIGNGLALLEDLITAIQNPRSRTIMRYFYLLGWSDAQIGAEMELTEEWVRKKRYAAVRRLEREWKNALA